MYRRIPGEDAGRTGTIEAPATMTDQEYAEAWNTFGEAFVKAFLPDNDCHYQFGGVDAGYELLIRYDAVEVREDMRAGRWHLFKIDMRVAQDMLAKLRSSGVSPE